jgi:hypothetical protein
LDGLVELVDIYFLMVFAVDESGDALFPKVDIDIVDIDGVIGIR